MAVHSKNEHYRLSEIQRRHWNTVAHGNGVGENAEQVVGELLEATPRVLAEVGSLLPQGFPAVVADKTLEGLRLAAQKLEQMPLGFLAGTIRC
jgi:serine/threonine-protein kinase HipA